MVYTAQKEITMFSVDAQERQISLALIRRRDSADQDLRYLSLNKPSFRRWRHI